MSFESRCFLIESKFLLTELRLNHVLSENDLRNAKNALDSLPSDLKRVFGIVMKKIEKKHAKDIALRTLS